MTVNKNYRNKLSLKVIFLVLMNITNIHIPQHNPKTKSGSENRKEEDISIDCRLPTLYSPCIAEKRRRSIDIWCFRKRELGLSSGWSW